MISSINSKAGFPGYVTYGVSKGGVDSMVQTLSVEWGGYGIRVNAINPGSTDNIMNGLENFYAGGNKEDTIKSLTPIPRRGRAEELIGPTIFLASNASSYVTGITLLVDGGYCAR